MGLEKNKVRCSGAARGRIDGSILISMFLKDPVRTTDIDSAYSPLTIGATLNIPLGMGYDTRCKISKHTK